MSLINIIAWILKSIMNYTLKFFVYFTNYKNYQRNFLWGYSTSFGYKKEDNILHASDIHLIIFIKLNWWIEYETIKRSKQKSKLTVNNFSFLKT
jgi:hypothetical protein